MGFNFKPSTEGCATFEAVALGDDNQTFLQCVQRALEEVRLDITVDVNGRAQSLGAVLPHLFKLQKLTANHNKKVKLKGLQGKVPADYLKRLVEYGFEIEGMPDAKPKGPEKPTHTEVVQSVIGSAMTSAPPVPRSVVTITLGAQAQAAPPTGTADDLPSAPVLEGRLKGLKERLSHLLQRKRFLENEKKTYVDRVKVLSKGLDFDDMNQESLQKISQLEGTLHKLNEEKTLFQKRVEETVNEKKVITEAGAKSLVDAQTNHKKKKEALDKKLAELAKAKEKVTAEISKKKFDKKQSPNG